MPRGRKRAATFKTNLYADRQGTCNTHMCPWRVQCIHKSKNLLPHLVSDVDINSVNSFLEHKNLFDLSVLLYFRVMWTWLTR